jgi:hypothetical protein
VNRYNAPPVVYPSGRSGFEACGLVLAWTAGLLTLVGWQFSAGGSTFVFAAVAAVLLLAGVAARICWRGTKQGQLHWDGQCWRWETQAGDTLATEQSICVIADFQSWLLIRMENQFHARQWLWLERKNAPDYWLDLRRAIYSPPRASSFESDLELQRNSELTNFQR